MQEQIGRYEIKRELGRGGMATVYLAFDPRFRRQVAIKVLPRQFMHDPRFLARFEQEAQTIAALEHPAIVPVHDFGESNDAPYLVMRYMAGGSLRDRLSGETPSFEQIAVALERLAPALDKAHAMGIIHRDLKPANILYDDDGYPYLADFGIARIAEASQTLSMVGTPGYISPEQAQGGLELDGRSDIYALGVILYELFTGRQPYEGDTPVKLIMAHVLEPIPDAREANPDLPPAAQEIIEKTMAKNREDRYATTQELAVAMRELADSARVRPEPATAVDADTAEHPPDAREPAAAQAALAASALTPQDEPAQAIPDKESTPPPLRPPDSVNEAGEAGDSGAAGKVPRWLWWAGALLVGGIIFYFINFFLGPSIIQPPEVEIETSVATVTKSEATSLPAKTAVSGEFELFTSWTDKSQSVERSALAVLLEILSARNPEMEIINAANLVQDPRAELMTRLANGRPPDSFQLHAGQELITGWAQSGYIEPVTFIFQENEWLDSYHPAILDAISSGGEIWGVPVNIHRTNVLWYNTAVLEEHGYRFPPRNYDEFFEMAETLQKAGITPLALGSEGTWAATHLFETVLLDSLGPQSYSGLWTGETDWNGPEVTAALETFKRLMEYVDDDRAHLSWDEAASLVAEGEAAMTIMGDWTHGYFQSLGLEAGEDYGWTPAPGTGGSFTIVSDAFVLPENAPHRDAAVAWLEVIGSREGQDAFNPIKGSIPARSDPDHTLYDLYQLSLMEDFRSAEVTLSLTHDTAVSTDWLYAFTEIMARFISDLDVDAAQKAMASACVEAGVCD